MKRLLPLAALLLVGCVTNPNGGQELSQGGKAALKEVAVIAVSRYVRENADSGTVQRVREALIELQALPDITTVDGLKAIVAARIEAKVTDPYDREDLTRLLNVVAPLLADYVGADQLEPDAVVKVREFLGYLAAALPVTQEPPTG